eukprot:3008895-Rhodomonas_salina.3
MRRSSGCVGEACDGRKDVTVGGKRVSVFLSVSLSLARPRMPRGVACEVFCRGVVVEMTRESVKTEWWMDVCQT